MHLNLIHPTSALAHYSIAYVWPGGPMETTSEITMSKQRNVLTAKVRKYIEGNTIYLKSIKNGISVSITENHNNRYEIKNLEYNKR